MKLLKKKAKKDKKDKIIISEPLSVVSENGAQLNENPRKTENNSSKDISRNLSKDSRRSSRSSLPSASFDGSILDDSEFDSDEDFSDVLSDEEITIGDESTIIDVEKKPSKPKKQREPIVNSCCGFCSLGAGSLLTGIMYICLGIGFLVYRINDFNYHVEKSKTIYTGTDFYKDIWRVLLVSGMAVIAISMVGALILLVASCVFGQKEHYSKMRIAVIIWSVVTALAVIWNVGEGVYVIMIPTEFDQKVGTGIVSNRLVYKDIKAQLPTVWALTGIHTLFYIYLVIVLVSYLRLLKYKGAPKVGGTDVTTGAQTSRPGSRANGSIRSGSRPGRNTVSRTTSAKALNTISKDKQSAKPNDSRLPSQTSISANDFRLENSTYVNWSHIDDDSALGSSPVNESKTNEDEESMPGSSIYDFPPGDTYDAPPENYETEEDKAPEPLPKDFEEIVSPPNRPTSSQEELKIDDLNAKANSMLTYSNLVLNEMQKESAPSVADESTYSFPRSNPVSEPDLLLPKPKASMEENDRQTKRKQEEELTEPKIEPATVSKIFKRLSDEREAENPLEEMFRLFGGDLCTQHPENCERYLKSYKDVRSKTSHLSSLKDNFEFGKLDGEMQQIDSIPPPQQFSMNVMDNYGTDNSVISQNPSVPFMQLPSRQFSQSSFRPEPVYDFRPRSRDERISYQSQASNFRDAPPQNFWKSQNPTSTLPHFRHFSDNRPGSVYSFRSRGYDSDACSTCYGEYGYGDYSDCYSFGGYYPQHPQRPQQRLPSQVYSSYDTLPSRSSRISKRPSLFNQSASQFKEVPRKRQSKSNNAANSAWIPLKVEDDYSVYGLNENFRSSRSRSLPNLAEPEPEPEDTLSIASNDTAFSKPLSPEFTLPSPRETNRISRSSSWANFHNQTGRASENSRGISSRSRVSRTDSAATIRNYSGYHTGDLRRKTSHTSEFEPGSWQDRNSQTARNSSQSTRPGAARNQRWSSNKRESFTSNPPFEPMHGRGRALSRLTSSDSFSYTPSNYSGFNSEILSRQFPTDSNIRSRNSSMNSYPSHRSRFTSDIQSHHNRTGPDHSRNTRNLPPQRTRTNSDHSQMKPSIPPRDIPSHFNHSRMNPSISSRNTRRTFENSRVNSNSRPTSDHFRASVDSHSRFSRTNSELSRMTPDISSRSYRNNAENSRRNSQYSESSHFTSRPSNKSYDPHKHGLSAPRGQTSRREPSIESSRGRIPYRDSSRGSEFQNKPTFRRSKSVRRSEPQDLSAMSKQEKLKFKKSHDDVPWSETPASAQV